MSGEASFEWGGSQCLLYKERGRIQLKSGTTHDAHRSYIYTRLPDGFSIWFADAQPRLFHEVHLYQDGACWVADATHLCGDDTYVTFYRFAPDGSFFVRHDVAGPRKSYVSTTRFVRR